MNCVIQNNFPLEMLTGVLGKHETDIVAADQPVLCASCHRSNALAEVGGPGGDPSIENMSSVMHGFHGRLQVNNLGGLIRDGSGE